MVQSTGFYDFDKRLRTARRVLNEAPIRERNRTLIQDYLSARQSDGIGAWQILSYLAGFLAVLGASLWWIGKRSLPAAVPTAK